MKKESALIGVTDMMCEHCEKSVEKALAAVGVKAKADRIKKQVSVVYDPAKVGMDAIKAAIKEAGFTVE
jgi:copper chaperone CopZ